MPFFVKLKNLSFWYLLFYSVLNRDILPYIINFIICGF
ncbi:hypothetical protein BCD_0857 (plasmid) [Borrelia crocidurae DOU]|uniref:Uncharacterized protein n=1 Tax=Borrelia crocidurae DOU TaxID=1293575 RepID=W5SJV5_9SPIR|nr:hypothetical protein BCD_0857 [Borrelia crocidurae DOU]